MQSNIYFTMKYINYSIFGISILIFVAESGTGKCSSSSKHLNSSAVCEWYGCSSLNSLHRKDCPKTHFSLLDRPCGNDSNTRGFFCCLNGTDFSGKALPYLTPADFTNALNFADPKSDDIPMPKLNDYDVDSDDRNAKIENIWDGGIIPYILDTTFSLQDRAEVAKAVNNYQGNTCLRFYPKAPWDDSWIDIEGDDNTDTTNHCGVSEVCKKGGRGQFAKFGGGCRNAEWMVHELGHSLCFSHEQNRFDRDDYIFFDRKVPGCEPTPKKTPGSMYSMLGLPFDYYSIQMYRGCTPGKCIQRKQGEGPCGSLWNGEGRLTELDIRKINKLYSCDCERFKC